MKRVVTDQFRSDLSGIYYTIFKGNGRQVKKSLESAFGLAALAEALHHLAMAAYNLCVPSMPGRFFIR